MVKDLEVRHCRALVAVHEGGGIGVAARTMGVAQSTVSETLLSLERLLGVRMTARRAGREAVLTAAAEALLPHARSLIAMSQAALESVSEGRSTLRLGTVESISSFLLPKPLRDFRRLQTRTNVHIVIGLCEDLRRRVAEGELDAALTIEQSDAGEAEELLRVPLRLFASPQNRLADARVTPGDLAGETLLLSDAEGAFDRLVRGWAGGTVHPPKFESAGSVEGVKRGVLASDMIGILPQYAVGEELAAGALSPLHCAAPLPFVSLRLTSREPATPASPLAVLIGMTCDVLERSSQELTGPSPVEQ